MSNFVIGPIAPQNNPPIKSQYYQPSVFDIQALTLGATTIVTTTVDHNYVVGQLIRLVIPASHGSTSLNETQGFVLTVPAANQVQVTINSTESDPFIESPSSNPTPAQIMAIGDINSGQINSNGRIQNITYINGSFINISPQ